jgi:hypothetical protein
LLVSFAVSRMGGEEVVEYRLDIDCGVSINEVWVLWACEVPILFGSVRRVCTGVLLYDVESPVYYKDILMFASISMDVQYTKYSEPYNKVTDYVFHRM